jgi:hypothetical protein
MNFTSDFYLVSDEGSFTYTYFIIK